MHEDELREWLRGLVSEPRFLHSIGVMETATELARKHGVDAAPLRIAALLHDCAREHTNDVLLSYAGEWGLPVREVDRLSPVLLHGRLAAAIARRELGIDDPAVISAVCWHTAGHPEMSLSDKIFFLADVLEPTRPHGWTTDLYGATLMDIDRGVLMAIDINEEHLVKTGKVIDPDTDALRQVLRQRG